MMGKLDDIKGATMETETFNDMPSDLTLTRFWNSLAKTEPVSAEDFIGWAIDRYGDSRGYLLAFNRWVDKTGRGGE